MEKIEILEFDNNEDVILTRYGENLLDRKYITNPAIERDEEIKKMILALLIPEKSAILVGKPGVGKTALVEGLAYQIQQGTVPNVLKKYQIIKINISALLGTTSQDGNTETKIQTLVEELKTKENVILFIDEIHTLIGASANNSIDFANMLKTGLDRGSIKIIGATTTEEFDFYLVKDRAFLRRFEKIEIEEPDQETTVKILIGSLPKIEVQTGAKLDYSPFVLKLIIKFIVNMTSEYKRLFEATSKYPDISFTLLIKAFAFAIFDNQDKVTFKHIYEAISSFDKIYPDVLKKEKIAFQKQFHNFLEEENVDLNKFKDS
ncbi:MAG: AAA family ATPase [Bacilli bacterium]|jgi:SpoVK/Ycf46/Vps4 family AAA+-type ATPase